MAKDNPPAFPTEWSPGLEPGEEMQTGANTTQFPGMTLRDWFAGQIAQGFVVRQSATFADAATAARFAYKYADAMLAQRAEASNG